MSFDPIPTTPTPVCCLKDYEVADCYNACSARTCANLRLGGDRVCTLECQLGVCFCKGDMYQNDCGDCVSKEKCNVPCKQSVPVSCSGPFETLNGCWDPSQARVCPTVDQSVPRDLFLKYITQPNTNGSCVLNVCDCQPGYLRNRCGVCVKPEFCGGSTDCNGIQCNGANEELKTINTPLLDCMISTSCKKKCKKNRKCKCKRSKKNRCRRHKRIYQVQQICGCKDGFARNKCDRCVPVSQANDDTPCVCTNPCRSDPYKEWSCFNECFERTCENMYTLPSKICPQDCNYGCQCRNELWWNGTACVAGSMCPPQGAMSTSSPVNNNGPISSGPINNVMLS